MPTNSPNLSSAEATRIAQTEESPAAPEQPPLAWRQRSMVVLVFLTALMLALPFFLLGWGLRGPWLERQISGTTSEDAVARAESAALAPLRQVLEDSTVLPPPAPLVEAENQATPRFPEWRPLVTTENAAAWEEFVSSASAVPLGEFTEDGTTWRQFLVAAEKAAKAPDAPPAQVGSGLLLVLPLPGEL